MPAPRVTRGAQWVRVQRPSRRTAARHADDTPGDTPEIAETSCELNGDGCRDRASPVGERVAGEAELVLERAGEAELVLERAGEEPPA